jgi:flagellar assembly protein FliH
MTSSDELITKSSNEVTPEELAEYQRWQAPRMVSVTDVEDKGYLTVDDIEAMQKEAQEEGFQAGFKEGKDEGYKAGLQAGQVEINQQVSYLRSILTQLNTPLHDLDDVIEQDIVQLVTMMTKQVINKELALTPESVIDSVKSAMSALPITDRKLKIYLHPDDHNLVKSAISTEESTAWQWIDDKAMTRGGCRLETANTTIDATVEKKISSVIETFLGEPASDD